MARHLFPALSRGMDSLKSTAMLVPKLARTIAPRIGGLLALLAATSLSADGVQPVILDVALERLGEPRIERANSYSENTRVRVRLVYPAGHVRAGQRYAGAAVPVVVEEWNSRIYDGQHGATKLPAWALAVDGEVEIELKSLARYAHFDMRNMPIPQIAVSAGGEPRLLQIPQWVDADGNDKTDWLERRVDDLLKRARASAVAEVARAARALDGWEQSLKRDCGGFDEQHPGWIAIAPACLDWDGVDSHRVNRGLELTATVLHELWHAYSHSRAMKEPGVRRWPKAPARQFEPLPCPGNCSGPVWLADPRYAAQETEAEAFADRHKHLFP